MAFDGLVLNQLCKELQENIPAKINKIQQVSDTEILFTLRCNNQNRKLMISCHSNYNRIHFTNRVYTTPDIPQSFIMVLRKHISGAIITQLTQLGLDRILCFSLQARNELGDIHQIKMYVELMGKYANIILVNDENKVIDALKRIPPFENSVRTIHPGAMFVPVKPQANKLDPFNAKSYDIEESFTKQFHGFSPILSNEFHYRLRHQEDFTKIMESIKNSHSIFISEKDDKQYFHVIPLKHLEVETKEYPLQEAMDILYYEKEEKVRIKEQSGDLFKIVSQELKKSRNKLLKLEKTLDDAYDLENYRVYGDLLYAYAYQFPHKVKEAILPSFETGEDMIIPLDEKIDVKQNAKKYYQKYQKAKTAQIEVAKQIALTKETIAYFEILEAQLEQASFLDALEIREELTSHGYMRKKQRSIQRKKKTKPNFMTLKVNDTFIYIGKNNVQNDYITWKQSRKEHLWLHAKDIHGSHVVIAEANPSEEVLRIAAMFAAYYSKGRLSSSVPVNYCSIRQLKKPNKAALGFVTLSNYKTIYIDPEEEMIKQYIQNYQI
ncbi:MAG: fibronectin/fibrinogen-binding protein [Erysipelotrichia bacterium]|nr:fibronectin/fibrinogen-binding protein [Erysipelotrichia bacterium]NCC55067.1 fibronectin/fibrinogen-binding protein [Erysipelotrichia bacterium]